MHKNITYIDTTPDWPPHIRYAYIDDWQVRVEGTKQSLKELFTVLCKTITEYKHLERWFDETMNIYDKSPEKLRDRHCNITPTDKVFIRGLVYYTESGESALKNIKLQLIYIHNGKDNIAKKTISNFKKSLLLLSSDIKVRRDQSILDNM